MTWGWQCPDGGHVKRAERNSITVQETFGCLHLLRVQLVSQKLGLVFKNLLELQIQRPSEVDGMTLKRG